MSSNYDAIVDRYVEGQRDGDRYYLGLDELSGLLRSSLASNNPRLGLLTALQRALPSPRGEAEELPPHEGRMSALKAALTNVIIMQTRLNEREQEFSRLLGQAIDEGTTQRIEVAEEDLRGWAEAAVGAYRHLQQRDSQPHS